MATPLYPLKFKPRYLDKMWGGKKLHNLLARPVNAHAHIGESWEVYDFPPTVVDHSKVWISSEIANGPLAGKTLHELVLEYGQDLCGDVPLVGPLGQFPILIKFLDARQDLSVQVHPDADYAAAHPGAHLKSEAWYVVQADQGSRILCGLRPGITRETFGDAIATGQVESAINSICVEEGQCFYLPSGTVHALGAGILAAEVQTPSDTTFRVYDFDRIDPTTKKKRELHVEQALQCIDFTHTDHAPQPDSLVSGLFTAIDPLVNSEHFNIIRVRCSDGVEQPVPCDQPMIWMMLEGQGQVSVADLEEPTHFAKGDTVLFPASLNDPMLVTEGESLWLEITLPRRGR